MSCFICDEKHISALAGYAEVVERDYHRLGGSRSPKQIAKILYDANVRSFAARYEGRHAEDICEFEFDARAALKGSHANSVSIIKSASCFEYQACEFEDWETSEAKKIIRAITSHAISKLPGYEQAAWGSPV
jgi:hypothetical protein